jgi:hypothetical protein
LRPATAIVSPPVLIDADLVCPVDLHADEGRVSWREDEVISGWAGAVVRRSIPG